MADDPSDSELLATLQASVDADTLTDAAYEATHQALYQVRKRLYGRKTETAQQAQRIAELEAENASLRANSFAAAAERLREAARDYVEAGLDDDEVAHLRQVADWLSRQAPQGAQQQLVTDRLDALIGDFVPREATEADAEFMRMALTEGAQQRRATFEQLARDAANDLEGAPSLLAGKPPIPHETAPRLTKGVRYRVVEASKVSRLQPGHVFKADGTELLGGDDYNEPPDGGGWYDIEPLEHGWYRVVRVEPEKCERCIYGKVWERVAKRARKPSMSRLR